ncbi:hypothetical protein JHK87_011746 [Glycine soja]|nr:hypothetical protein JHK87_011746 [Glycine soja]
MNLKEYWYSHSTALVLALCIIISMAWHYFLKLTNNTQKRLPPGLPIFGNLLSLDPDLLHTYFAGLTQIHGPILKLRLGSKLTSPGMVLEVLKETDTVFASHDVTAAAPT